MSDVILFLYRVAMRLRRWHIPVLPVLIQYAIRLTFGCHISLGAEIGPRTHLAYGGLGTVIHSAAVIGRNVYVGTNVTVGGRNGADGAPVIEDNCFIGTGAKLLGDIVIGRDSVVGANSVVLIDVPERSCAAGVPAKIVRTDIDLAQYRTQTDMRRYVSKPAS
jgi:serine O-acetyltransferase